MPLNPVLPALLPPTPVPVPFTLFTLFLFPCILQPHARPHPNARPCRRQQLKALVDIHGEAQGMGGKLSMDEIKVITGAVAWGALT